MPKNRHTAPITWHRNPWTPPNQLWTVYESRVKYCPTAWNKLVWCVWVRIDNPDMPPARIFLIGGGRHSSREEAMRDAIDCARGFAKANPNNPNPARVFGENGHCATAFLGDQEIGCNNPGAPELILTPEQMARAKSNKCVGYIWMRAIDFLRLTTPSDAYIFAILPDEGGLQPRPYRSSAAKTLDFYNNLSLTGEITVPPFLQVDLESGAVIGHEGRHRAAALYHIDPEAKMRVSIELFEKLHPVYYREDGPPKWTKTFLSVADIPKELTTQQFRSGIYTDWGARNVKVRIDLKGAQNYWYGQKPTWD